MADLTAAAISVIKRAVELDNCGRYKESLTCYETGIEQLLQVSKKWDALDIRSGFKLADFLLAFLDETRRSHYRQKIEEYMKRAEAIKEIVLKEKDATKYHEQIHIAINSTGHTLESIFVSHLDATVTEVEVEDPYIRSHHQIVNFLRFCEMLVSSVAKVQRIVLITGPEESPENHNTQRSKIDEIGKSLKQYNITLEVQYSTTLHDREIRFNNGCVVKIGRGLDFYKAAPGKFAIGQYEMKYRPCHETTVDIYSRVKPK